MNRTMSMRETHTTADDADSDDSLPKSWAKKVSGQKLTLQSVFSSSLRAKSYGVTIQLKPLQQYFHMGVFIEYVVLTFESVDEIL